MPRPKGLPKTGGKQKGYKAPKTLAKEAAREAARVRITARMHEIIDAQVDSAIGIAHFMIRDAETGQWQRLTNVKKIEEALNHPKAQHGSTFWIYTKDPNPSSARDMLAYALDKPKEQVQEIKLGSEPQLIEALMEGRQRAAKAKKG